MWAIDDPSLFNDRYGMPNEDDLCLAHRSTCATELFALIDRDPGLSVTIAGNNNAPEEVLRYLYQKNRGLKTGYGVRSLLASNHNTPHDILDELLRDPYADIRLGVARNPNVPANAFSRLLLDEEIADYI